MKTAPFLIRAAICLLLSLVPLGEFENSIYSYRMRLRGQWSDAPGIVILRLQTSDLSYWDPSLMRGLLSDVLASDPKAVLISWFVPGEAVEAFPLSGIETVARHPKVIWSSSFHPDGGFSLPPERFRTDSNHGFNTLLKDNDGVVRRLVLRQKGEPSLARRLAERAGISVEDEGEPRWINYAGPAGTVGSCSLSEWMARPREGACASLSGKIVLISSQSDVSAFGSYFQTPLGEMSRAEVLANEIHSVLDDHPVHYIPIWVAALVILAMIFCSAYYIVSYPVMISAIAVTGTGVVVVFVLFQVIFQASGVYIPSANVALSMLLSYLVFTGYRLAIQEDLQWRTLKQSQYLRELDQMKTNFLSLVSHDLKTPIAKIQAVSQRMRRELQLPESERGNAREFLDSIDTSTTELRNYITSILNLSKIESQKVMLNKKSNDINRIIRECLSRLKSVAQGKSIEIEEHLEPIFSVECDEDLIRQVLTNLVDNAIKYSPESSKVIVRSREEENVIRVDVEDFGPGIPKDQIPLMFRKFSRLHRPMKGQPRGTGLGLYLSKYFIELHGGTIQLRTEEGKGTTFTFTLPIHEDSFS